MRSRGRIKTKKKSDALSNCCSRLELLGTHKNRVLRQITTGVPSRYIAKTATIPTCPPPPTHTHTSAAQLRSYTLRYSNLQTQHGAVQAGWNDYAWTVQMLRNCTAQGKSWFALTSNIENMQYTRARPMRRLSIGQSSSGRYLRRCRNTYGTSTVQNLGELGSSFRSKGCHSR